MCGRDLISRSLAAILALSAATSSTCLPFAPPAETIHMVNGILSSSCHMAKTREDVDWRYLVESSMSASVCQLLLPAEILDLTLSKLWPACVARCWCGAATPNCLLWFPESPGNKSQICSGLGPAPCAWQQSQHCGNFADAGNEQGGWQKRACAAVLPLTQQRLHSTLNHTCRWWAAAGWSRVVSRTCCREFAATDRAT